MTDEGQPSLDKTLTLHLRVLDPVSRDFERDLQPVVRLKCCQAAITSFEIDLPLYSVISRSP
jgi:hypothetical protein